MKRDSAWNPAHFFVWGATVGALLGAAWSWMDYGRLDIGFMYSWVLGSAALLGFAAAVIALVRNWIARNPMA